MTDRSSGKADSPLYITTPIYYVNDRPHIGHVYTTTICDVWARFHRFAGRDVFFLTGTDEHGVKVEQSAAAKGVPPQELADQNAAEFQSVLSQFDLTNDDFIRTTQGRHTQQVETIVQRLIDQGDVYLGEYEGWYDEGQEEFIPDNKAEAQEFKSAISGRDLVRMKEANYFFRLSAYQDRLQKWYDDHPDFVKPEARRNEMLGRLREGLNDIPVSRTSFSWGVKVPGDEKHVLWVWLDALSNYITPLGATDANFAVEHFHEVYNTDLVNTLGNCASRVTAMMNKYFDGVAPEPNDTQIADHDWLQITNTAVDECAAAFARFDLSAAIESALGLIRKVDAFINATEPFKLAKDESQREQLATILYQCLEAVRIASLLLWAVCPAKMNELWAAIGQDVDPSRGDLLAQAQWGGLQPGTAVKKVALFPRVDAPTAEPAGA